MRRITLIDAGFALALLAILAASLPYARIRDALGFGPTRDSADVLARLPEGMLPPLVPKDNPTTPAKAALGRHLFYDARLSADGTLACASCHDQRHAFSDTSAYSAGVHGAHAAFNAPSLANVAYMRSLTWENPQIKTLERQMLVPMFGDDPEELGMGGREDRLFARLKADPYYPAAFARAFPDRGGVIDLFTVTRAIAAFERTILSFDSPYDRYKRGAADAISAAAKEGEKLFFDHRFECYHCHQGPTFSENFATENTALSGPGFHNIGLYGLGPDGGCAATAHGLSAFTGESSDEGRFRTPSLRNVALTGPYMHDGSVATLAEVLDIYGRGGRLNAKGKPACDGAQNPYKDGLIVGFSAGATEKAEILAFLQSLTDESLTTDPALADPWPEDSPARRHRRLVGAAPAAGS